MKQDESPVTHPDELQRHFAGLSPTARWVTAIVLVLTLGASALFARPAWRALKHFRASTFAKSAVDAQAQGNTGLALDHAHAALQLDPHNPDFLRLNARLLTELGTDACLPVWQNLAQRTNASADDQMSLIEAAIAFRRLDLVGPTFSNLSASGNPSPRLQRLGALYHLGSGASNAALACARLALQLEPGNPTNAFLVASLLASSADAPDRARARSLLREVVESNGPLRLMALRRLVHTDLGERSDRDWIAQTLSRIPKRTASEEVLLAETLVRLDPTVTRLTFSNLVAQIPHDSPEMLTLVVEALARLGLHDDVLNLTLGDRGYFNRSLFQARLDALSARHRHAEAYRHLLTPGAPMPAFDLALAKIKASVVAQDSTRRDAHFDELVQACGDNPDRLRAVAEIAENQGSLEVAARTWKQLGTLPDQAAVAHRGLQRVADRRGDTWTARDHAQLAMRSGIPNPSLKLEIAYYDILLGENIDAALAEAQTYATEHPRDFFCRATVALGHLRLGAPDKARTVLDRFLLDDPQPRADALAVLAATCGQNGFVVRAREIASRISLERLRPEERELVGPWLAPLPESPPP